MVTIEQKLSLFSKLLQQDISNEISEKMSDLEQEYEVRIKEHKALVDQQADEIMERAQRRADIKKTEYLSRAHMQTKREYMMAKEKQVGRFMDALTQQIDAYTQTEAYREYLEQLVGRCQNLQSEDALVVYMTAQDLQKYQENIINSFSKMGIVKDSLTFKERDVAMLGGLIIENQKRTMRIDLSIASRIRDQKEKIIGRIFEALGEVGE